MSSSLTNAKRSSFLSLPLAYHDNSEELIHLRVKVLVGPMILQLKPGKFLLSVVARVH